MTSLLTMNSEMTRGNFRFRFAFNFVVCLLVDQVWSLGLSDSRIWVLSSALRFLFPPKKSKMVCLRLSNMIATVNKVQNNRPISNRYMLLGSTRLVNSNVLCRMNSEPSKFFPENLCARSAPSPDFLCAICKKYALRARSRMNTALVL